MPVLARCTEYHPDRIYDFDDFGRIEGSEAKEGERPPTLATTPRS